MKIVPYHLKFKSAILGLWNATMISDPLSEKRFLEKIILDKDFNPDLCLVAVKEDEVVGFLWSVVEGQDGWINAVCIDEENQSQGIGSALIMSMLKEMKEQGVTDITVGAHGSTYLYPGVDCQSYPRVKLLFEKFGFKTFSEAVSMERSLFDFRKTKAYQALVDNVKKQGFHLNQFYLQDAEELIAFVEPHFGKKWARNVQQAILENKAHDTILVLRDEEDAVVGYAQRAIDGNPDRFGPFGVMETLRGKGLGTVLFNEMLFHMFSKGITHVYFLWTGGNAQRFYEKNGMTVYREYVLMKKRIEMDA